MLPLCAHTRYWSGRPRYYIGLLCSQHFLEACHWRKNMKLGLLKACSIAALSLVVSGQALAQEKLYIYNWSDYIAEDTISNFEKATGIKVTYDVYDSNEVLEAKLLAGRSGYDLVFPTALPFADRLIRANLYAPLDKSKLSHYGNLDPIINKSLADIDAGNQYAVPYMWGTTGIAYNKDKVEAILGKDMPKDTKDYSKEAIQEAADAISAVRPNIRYFHNSQTINDIANGDICVAHGYSGDMLQAQARAKEANNGVQVEYVIPREGAVLWTDVMVIPADAKNIESAHKFINYLLQPEVIATVSNYVAYANANKQATPLVDADVRNNPGIYPPETTLEKLLTLKTPSDREARVITRAWTRTKTGR